MLFSMSFEPYQGRYLRAYNEAKTLVENGYHVTVLGWDRSGKSSPFEVRDGIRIERIFEKAPDRTGLKTLPNFARYCARVLSHLKNVSFDVVHCHNLQLLPLGILFKQLRKTPLIFDSCEPDYFALYPDRLQGIVKFMERFMAKRSNAICVHNDYQVTKYRTMGHPMVELIGSYPTKEMIRNNYESPPAKEKTVLGRIGSIYQDNGIEEIIEGFKLVSPNYNGIELLLAGRVFDSYKNTFARIINGLESRVSVSGAFDSKEMPALYGKIDVSIILYHRSAWFKNITPTKFFDSLAMGVPVIASDMGGLREIINHYQCGIVVDESNPKEVAEAIELMCRNPDLRHEMGLNGLRAIKERYHWELMQERLLGIYGKLLQ